MKLLVLAVVLSLAQTVPPVPRQTPDKQAHKSPQSHQGTDADKRTTTAESASSRPPSAPHSNETSGPATQGDTEKTITISKLPTVAVDTGPNWWNRIYVIFTGLLVGVGIGGVYYARKTLLAINSQLTKMGEQKTEMHEQVEAMKAQLEQMKKAAEQSERMILQATISAEAANLNAVAAVNAERAWVLPELTPLVRFDENAMRWRRRDGSWLAPQDVLLGRHLRYVLGFTNIGKTPAQILAFHIEYACLPESVSDELPVGIKGIVISESPFRHFLAAGKAIEMSEPTVIDVHSCLSNDMTLYDKINAEEFTAVFYGWVKYRHIFSSEDCFADFLYAYTPALKRLSSAGTYPRQRTEQVKQE